MGKKGCTCYDVDTDNAGRKTEQRRRERHVWGEKVKRKKRERQTGLSK